MANLLGSSPSKGVWATNFASAMCVNLYLSRRLRATLSIAARAHELSPGSRIFEAALKKASIESAKARQADAFILVPQFMPEERGEREIRRRVLDESGLPYLLVRLDQRWRIPGDGHPDARANRNIATQIASRLGHRTESAGK